MRKKVRLGDYVDIKTGKLDANASIENGEYPFFTCSVTTLKIDTYSYDCECVLVAGNGDLNVKYYNGKFDAYQRTYIIESKEKDILSVPYLYCFLDKYVETLRKQAIGGVIKYIKLGNLTNAKINIPTMEEQKSVVLELNKINDIINKRKQQFSKLDELVKARFVEMFGGINDSKIYPYKAVKELTDVISGGTPSREVNEYWKDGTIPWVKTTELHNNIIIEIDEYITKAGLDNSSAKLVPMGTILIAMYGQGKTRGMTGYLGVEACTNQACACILPSDSVNQKFLWQYFVLSYDNLRDMAKGGNQPNLNGNIIKNYPVLYPPMELQNQFAAFVEQTDKSKSEIQKSLEKLEMLKKALMQKYFG